LWDREYQDVYLARCDRPLAAFEPDRAEVIGLVSLPADTLVALARGRLRRVRTVARVATASGWEQRPVTLTRDRLVRRTGRYYEQLARGAARLAAGGSGRRGPGRAAAAARGREQGAADEGAGDRRADNRLTEP
jgi:hypothetical protein